MLDVFSLLVFIAPAYVANAMPVVIKARPKIPIDLKVKFLDKRRILGEGKTLGGFAIAILCGTLTGFVLSYIAPVYPTKGEQILSAFLLSFGAMAGDVVGSFTKRRLRFASGKPFIIDSLTFYLFAIIFAYPMLPTFFGFSAFFFLLILTMALHPLSNLVACKLKLKEVPW